MNDQTTADMFHQALIVVKIKCYFYCIFIPTCRYACWGYIGYCSFIHFHSFCFFCPQDFW